MITISTVITELKLSREALLKALDGLSKRELTQLDFYPPRTTNEVGWTVKDLLAHLIGWDERALNFVPLLLQNYATEISVQIDEYNQQLVEIWRDKSLSEVITTVKNNHRRLVDMLNATTMTAIDMRRECDGRIITIRNYFIDELRDHEEQHTAEIEQWRQNLEKQIDPAAIKATLAQNRAKFMDMVKSLDEATMLQKRVAGKWSIKDVLGHLAEWERLMLEAAQHIHDPSLPEVTMLSSSLDEWNKMMVARREFKPVAGELKYLVFVQTELDEFINTLRPGDWRLRGPYPWSNDQGTLAELITHASEHYLEHVEMKDKE